MAKKAAVKKSTAKKAKGTAKSSAPARDKKKPLTKNQMLSALADDTKLTKKQVGDVMDSLSGMIQKELSKKGPGVFTLPGMFRLKRAEKGPTPAREGRNPRTGETMMIPAQPKKTVVRARVLKALNESVK